MAVSVAVDLGRQAEAKSGSGSAAPATGGATSPGPRVSSAEAVCFGSGSVTVSVVETADPVVLMAALAVLSPREVECLEESEAEAYVVACERVTAAVHARQSLAMDTLAGRVDQRLQRTRAQRPLPRGVPEPDAQSVVASMLAPAMHCSTRALRKRLEGDRWLVCAGESTFSAQWEGDLERFRTDVVTEAIKDVSPELRATFEALVLETSLNQLTGELTLVSPRVRQLSRSQLARRAAAIARELDPDSHERAARRARGDRRVVVTPDRRRPGMARWLVLLPSQVSQEVFAAVEALAGQYARVHPGSPIDRHRADALADLVLGNAHVETTVELVVPVLAATGTATGAPQPGSCDAALAELCPVTATISPATPVGPGPALSPDAMSGSGAPKVWPSSPEGPDAMSGPEAPDARTGNASGEHQALGVLGQAARPNALSWLLPGPVDVPRHGELLPATTAELLSRPDTVVRLARLDPDGSITQDPEAYRPNRALRRRLRARDGTCRFPGCLTPAKRCDIDHVVPFPHGPTDARNLICLCRTHHRFKHHGGWRAVLHADGSVAWSAPDGRVHTTRSRPLQIAEDLHLADGLDGQLLHDLALGWYPGLPPGMSLADLVRAEASLPDDPPQPDEQHPPAPPVDLEELDALRSEDTREAAPSWDSTVGDELEDLTPLERTLAALLALAA